MRRAVIAILAAVLALGSLAGGASAARRMFVGFQDDRSFQLLPNRLALLDQARAANATVLRVNVDWSRIATRRPADPTNPADPAYDFGLLDQFVRDARGRGFQIVASVVFTPSWANGGKAGNYAPRNPRDLERFAQAVARRYSGDFGGLPEIRMFTVWNEPNTGIFLMPQYDKRLRSTSPQIYAKLYKAAYRGLKRGNSRARVAIGVTSPQGTARASTLERAKHHPGDFMRLLARACAGSCRFEAVAHHPYPTRPGAKALQVVNYPIVTLTQLDRFERDLQRWFGLRKPPRLWVTEYGHRTDPPDFDGVPPQTQARYAKQAIAFLRQKPYVDMVVWFIFRDDEGAPRPNVWEAGGGVLDNRDGAKPSYAAFRQAAAGIRPPF
jgi:hypothetical protein